MALRTTTSLLVTQLVLVLVTGVAATPVRFDQRQNGSFNVQVDLKDLEVYAIVEDEMLEEAMAQATDSVKPRPNIAADPHEGLKGAAPSPGGSGTRSGGEGVSAPSGAASSAASPATSANAPRRPNDKLANIKHKTLLPHERSDTSSSAELPWEAAEAVSAAREEELEPRGPTSVEARAAPAAPGAAPIAAAVGVPPAPSNRATQSQGVRPAGTVSVAHLHCGLGYYRDQNGRCRRSRRPSSSNTRKNHHHHGTRKHRPQPAKDAVKEASTEPSKQPVKEPSKEVVKDTPKDAVKDAPKEAAKEVAVKPAAVAPAPASPAGPGKGAAQDAAGEAVKEPANKDQEPLKEATKKDSVSLKESEDKVAVKDVPKEAVKDAAVKVQPSKVPVKDLAVTKDSAPKPAVAKPATPVQDRISSSSKNNNKEVVKQEDFKYVVKPPVREPVKAQVRQPAKPSPSKTKEAASKVPPAHHSHHHSQHHAPHKITVVKEDGKSRVQVPHKGAAVVPVAVVAAKPQAPASPAKRN